MRNRLMDAFCDQSRRVWCSTTLSNHCSTPATRPAARPPHARNDACPVDAPVGTVPTHAVRAPSRSRLEHPNEHSIRANMCSSCCLPAVHPRCCTRDTRHVTCCTTGGDAELVSTTLPASAAALCPRATRQMNPSLTAARRPGSTSSKPCILDPHLTPCDATGIPMAGDEMCTCKSDITCSRSSYQCLPRHVSSSAIRLRTRLVRVDALSRTPPGGLRRARYRTGGGLIEGPVQAQRKRPFRLRGDRFTSFYLLRLKKAHWLV